MLASRDKISVRQAIIFFLTIVHTSAIRLLPSNTAQVSQRAAWLTPLFTAVPFFILVLVIQQLFSRNRDVSLSDIITIVMGKPLGKVLLIIYLAWMLIYSGLYVRYFAEKFLTAMLPNSPLDFYTVTILAAVFYALRGGIVNFSRTVEFFFILTSTIFFLLFVLNIPNIEIINLFPVTHYDVWPIIKSCSFNLAIWTPFTFTFFFGDRINNKEHIRRYGIQGMVYLVVITSLMMIQTIGVYGYSVIQRISMPYIFTVKSVSLLKTIERIESIAVASWVVVDFSVISFYIYISVKIIKSIFSLSDEKLLLGPVTLISYVFSHYLASNRFELENFSKYISVWANIILGFVIPFIVLVVGKIRKKV